MKRALLLRPFFLLNLFGKYLCVSLGLRFLSPQTLVQWLSRRSGRKENDLSFAFKTAVGLDKYLSARNSCLRSALAAYWAAPEGTNFHLGVRKSALELSAHAWLERDGKCFSTDLALDSYEVIYSCCKR